MPYKPHVTDLNVLGTYRYKHIISFYPMRAFTMYNMRVLVLSATNMAYTVKFLEAHADGRAQGTVTRVQRKNVKLDVPAPHEIINRLPYKDND